MLLLNFSHPLTAEQLAQIETLTGQPAQVVDVFAQIDLARGLAEQAVDLAEQAAVAAGLSSADWQTAPMVVNPPGYAPAAAALLAELHGRMGHFPAILWIQAVTDTTVPRYRVAEIVNLEFVRAAARTRRRGIHKGDEHG